MAVLPSENSPPPMTKNERKKQGGVFPPCEKVRCMESGKTKTIFLDEIKRIVHDL